MKLAPPTLATSASDRSTSPPGPPSSRPRQQASAAAAAYEPASHWIVRAAHLHRLLAGVAPDGERAAVGLEGEVAGRPVGVRPVEAVRGDRDDDRAPDRLLGAPAPRRVRRRRRASTARCRHRSRPRSPPRWSAGPGGGTARATPARRSARDRSTCTTSASAWCSRSDAYAPGIPLLVSTTRGERTAADGTKPWRQMSDGASGLRWSAGRARPARS